MAIGISIYGVHKLTHKEGLEMEEVQYGKMYWHRTTSFPIPPIPLSMINFMKAESEQQG